ncbi:MAG: metallophosphoesterase [Bacillota bacterium]
MGRILVCSDIHGHLAPFQKLIEMAQLNLREDQLVLLGDYINRGPAPVESLRFVQKLHAQGAITLKGNNEDFFLDSLFDTVKRQRLYQSGLTATTILEFEALSEEEQESLLEFIKTMPLFHETDHYIFVHAGIRPGIHPSQCTKEDLLWKRDLINCRTGLAQSVIFGHIPTETGRIINMGDRIAMDCGAAFMRRLGMLELPSMREYYAEI